MKLSTCQTGVGVTSDREAIGRRVEFESRRQGSGFICLQVKLRDTSSAGVFGGVWEWQVRALHLRKRGRRTDVEGQKENNCRKMADPKIQGIHEGGGSGIGTGNPVDSSGLGRRTE